MALQSEEILAMTTLGVLGDTPPDALQPKLADGMHLRWGFGKSRSFPWYGYFLFRRRKRERKYECVSPYMRGVTEINQNYYTLPLGTFFSDKPLVLTDAFPVTGLPEWDLRNRQLLRFTFAEPVVAARCSIGFRKRRTVPGRDLICVGFDKEDERDNTNPRKKEHVVFTTFDREGKETPDSRLREINDVYALHTAYAMRIALPCQAGLVTLQVINGGGEGRVWGLNREGKRVAVAEIPAGSKEPQTITLHGEGIAEVVTETPQNETFLISVCFQCGKREEEADKGIWLRFYSGTTLLQEELLPYDPGNIIEKEFNANHITAVECSGGDAALIDICCQRISIAIRGGWEPLKRAPQPFYLPVRHPAYPASGFKPVSEPASQVEALDRIRYGNPGDWSGARFSAMHDAMETIVQGGPGGPAMKDVGDDNVPGIPATPSGQDNPNMAKVRPMNYLVMGSLYAPVAQMLGLYFVDEDIYPGDTYDYLVIADHKNVGHMDGQAMLGWINSPALNFTDVDAWVCFDCTLNNAPPLDAPVPVKAFSLPGSTTELPDGTVRDMTCNTGLQWPLPFTGSKLSERAAVMYMVRRAFLDDKEPASPVPPHHHDVITKTPYLVPPRATPAPGTSSVPSDWPDTQICYLDSGLKEGWYSYCINGVDIFGRYSGPSDAAAWYQWAPEPNPIPWYYQNGMGNAVVKPWSVRLLDKTPPPPPTGVEAFALDPEDPNLIRDAAYDSWFATLSASEKQTVTGLRVRWLWTYAQMRQAPDTHEFRLYYQDGQPNLLKGRVTGVAPAVADHSTVNTNITHTYPANALVGCYIRTGSRSFVITASSAASPLVLTVKNNAPDFSIPPGDGGVCSIAIPPANAHYQELTKATQWQDRVWVVNYNENYREGVAAAPEPGTDQQLAGENATAAASVITLPAGRNISGIRPFYAHVYLAEDTARASRIYKVIGVNNVTHQLMLDGNPNLTGGSSGWELGVLIRRYEIFLPVPGNANRDGVPLAPSIQQPVAYGQVGVTAVDDKKHTGDDAARAGETWGNRTGNESRIGGPATVYKVHRVPPPPVVMPPDSEKVYASKANYQGKAYYTFRWVPMDNVDTHVFRAMDQAVYQRDWLIRSTRKALNATTHEAYFPDGWAQARRSAAATALNAISGPASYTGLSADAQEVLGRLPGNEGHKSKGTVNTQDWLIRRTRLQLGAADTTWFPAEWGDVLKRQQAADQLNALNTADAYAVLGNDANRVLAALPGNETAFQQITHLPLSNTGADTANKLGPDNKADFVINPALRAYIDEIDGKSTNKYFYRAAFIDTAQNIGAMGLSSPAVYMPDIIPPRKPVFTRVLAGDPNPALPGDCKITLRWTSNREPDLASYRVFRTDKADNTRDIRLMQLVQEIAVPSGDPALRPAEVVWLDDTVQGLVSYYYRLVAVDTSGNQSAAAEALTARAFDTALPEVPDLDMEWVDISGVIHAEISWTSTHQVMIQRREGPGNWIDLAQWRNAGTVAIRDPFSDPEREYQYRAVVRKYTGALKRGDAETLPAHII